jgi:hypothetical protein
VSTCCLLVACWRARLVGERTAGMVGPCAGQRRPSAVGQKWLERMAAKEQTVSPAPAPEEIRRLGVQFTLKFLSPAPGKVLHEFGTFLPSNTRGPKHEAVRQFAKYNKAEILRVREEITAQVTELSATKKANRLAAYDSYIERLEADFWDETLTWVARVRLANTLNKLMRSKLKAQLKDLYTKHYQDLDSRLADPDLDDRTLSRLTREAVSILHKLSELMGWLPTRAQVEVASPTFMSEVVGWDIALYIAPPYNGVEV